MPNFIRKNGSRILTVLYTFALFFLNFIRIFDNNFWGDEAYTIRLAQMRLPIMFAETAGDVHPPLYYILVKLTGGILGYRGTVFHFTSLIPYVIVLVLALTVLWNNFGKTTSLILVTLASLLPTAVQYNVEVRMYSWGALFVLLSYLFLWRILQQNSRNAYVGFVIFSLAAAYTHYYCLVSVAFFYVVLFLGSLIQRRDSLKKTVVCGLVTVAGYLPWFFTLLKTLERTTDDFWMMWIPTLGECIAYFFSGSSPYILFAILIVGVIVFFIGLIRSPKNDAVSETSGVLSIQLKGFTLTSDAIWIIAGLSSMFGTILTGIMISRLIRPLFIVRYLYPVSILAWLLLGFCLSKLKGRIVYTAVVLGLLFLTCIPQYRTVFLNDRAENESLQATLAATVGEIEAGDVILTDLAQIDWTVSDYYYPDITHSLFSWDSFPEPENETEYWLILDAVSAKDNVAKLNIQGYSLEEKVNNGILGTSAVSVYRLYAN